MRLLEREMPMDPEVERELDAIDRALSGQRVDPDLDDLAQLALELRAERPEPGAEAEAKLDQLAAAGFPPRASDRLGRLRHGASNAFPRGREQGAHRLLPALGVACVFVAAIGIGVSQSGVLRGGENTAETTATQAQPPTALGAPGGDPQTERNAPTVQNLNTDRFTQHLPGADKARATAGALSPLSQRKVAQSVDLALSTSPKDFRGAADGVLDVVRAHRGFVVRSNGSGGDPGVRGAKRGRATFTLRIPAGELSGA